MRHDHLMRVLASIYWPTARRMLCSPRWLLNVVILWISWRLECLLRGRKPSVMNVPMRLVFSWPESPPTLKEIEDFNESIRVMREETRQELERLERSLAARR